VAYGRPALDESILCTRGAQLGGDALARLATARDYTQVNEEEWPVLDVEAAAELCILDDRAVTRDEVPPPLARQARLVALVHVLCKQLEERRRRSDRYLHERRRGTGTHRGQQPVHGRLTLVLEVVQ
jgi:hypothetical protein